jgi:hypothetical protein
VTSIHAHADRPNEPGERTPGQRARIHASPRHRPLPDDGRFSPVVEWVAANGAFGQPFLAPARFTENHDQARDVRRSLYDAARSFCSCGTRNCARQHLNCPSEANPAGGCPSGGQRVSCHATLVMHEGQLRVQFRLFEKRKAEIGRPNLAVERHDDRLWIIASGTRQIFTGSQGRVLVFGLTFAEAGELLANLIEQAPELTGRTAR